MRSAACACRVPLEEIEATTIEMVLPLLRALVDRGEAILLKLHDHDFGSDRAPTVLHAFSYVTELASHLAHSRCETSP